MPWTRVGAADVATAFHRGAVEVKAHATGVLRVDRRASDIFEGGVVGGELAADRRVGKSATANDRGLVQDHVPFDADLVSGERPRFLSARHCRRATYAAA
jgi:hypothetical protein